MRNINTWKVSKRTTLAAVTTVILLVVVSLLTLHGSTFGEVRPSQPRRSFKSGGARSELVLQEISATLKRIDQRLERLEKIAAKANQP